MRLPLTLYSHKNPIYHHDFITFKGPISPNYSPNITPLENIVLADELQGTMVLKQKMSILENKTHIHEELNWTLSDGMYRKIAHNLFKN